MLYEKAIRYYAAGLKFSGSNYGFPCIGSAMAISAIAYAKVRGFKKVTAGEDFYMLNKLAKLGEIITPKTQKIQVLARHSNRTPFGTGASVNRICQLKSLNDFLYYDPRCFHLLKEWFDHAPELAKTPVDKFLNRISPPLSEVLKEQKIEKLSHHLINHVQSENQAKNAIKTWFDGLACLKCIHRIQYKFFPALPFVQTLENHPFVSDVLLQESIDTT